MNLENVLVVGMTNRKELLDEALLRPGRMEVMTQPLHPIVVESVECAEAVSCRSWCWFL